MVDLLMMLKTEMEVQPLLRAGLILGVFMIVFWAYYWLKYFITGNWG